jgi:hypothetical protein
MIKMVAKTGSSLSAAALTFLLSIAANGCTISLNSFAYGDIKTPVAASESTKRRTKPIVPDPHTVIPEKTTCPTYAASPKYGEQRGLTTCTTQYGPPTRGYHSPGRIR